MAGSSSNIPVSDSYSPSFLESLFQDDQSNLWTENVPFSFTSLLSNDPLEVNVPPSIPPSIPPSTGIQSSNVDITEAGPSRRPVKRCRTMAELMESTDPSQLENPALTLAETTEPVQPREPAPALAITTNPFTCGCCHVLREIIHTNGLHFKKLEVHGRIGMICHAVFHQDIREGSSNVDRLQMFDFTNKNIVEIKHFLEQHCLNQRALGYTLVSDPLSAYYEALCVGLEWTKTPNEPLGGSFPTNTEIISSKGKEPEVEQNPQDVFSGLRLGDTYRANLEQRRRREAMSLQDFSNYFHLTLDETSRQLNLSTRAIKRICQREGLEDWPHKKLQRLMKLLYSLSERLPREPPITRVAIEKEIQWVQNEMIKVCGGVVPIVAYLT